MTSVNITLEEELKKEDFGYWLEEFGAHDHSFLRECVTNEVTAATIIEHGDDLTIYPRLAHWAAGKDIQYARLALLNPSIYNLGDERSRKVLHVVFGLHPELADEFEVFDKHKDWLCEADAEGITVAHVLAQYSDRHAKEIICNHPEIAELASKSPCQWKVVEFGLCAHEELALWVLEEEQRSLALNIAASTQRKDQTNVFFDISARFLSVAERIGSIPGIAAHKSLFGESVSEHAANAWHARGYSLKGDTSEQMNSIPSPSGFVEQMNEDMNEEGVTSRRKSGNTFW